MRLHQFLRWPMLAALLAASTACGSGDDAYVRVTASDHGALRQALGEIRLDDYDKIVLNVAEIRLRIHGEEGGSPWHSVPLATFQPGQDDLSGVQPHRIELDLLALLRGGSLVVAEGRVPAGKLTQIRFILDERAHGWAYPKGMPSASRKAVRVPSGSQSGLKLVGGKFMLEGGEDNDLELLFDASASIRDEDSNGIRIRPVVKLRNAQTKATSGD